MTVEETRLELLKLVHTHGKPATEVVARARELEAYLTEVAAPRERPTLTLPKKTDKAGTPARSG